MKGYFLDVKKRNWVVVCLANSVTGKTISVKILPTYFSSKKEAFEFAEDKSGEYLVYVYKRVKTFMPWSRRIADFLFELVD